VLRIRACEDIKECERLWNKAWPQECIFDLWPVRQCFVSCFKRKPYFLVAQDGEKIEGLLALSWIEEEQYYGQFPGETWQAKTWLEQNKIPTSSFELMTELLESVPGPVHLRYLAGESLLHKGYPLAVDEVGFLFFPGKYGFSFQEYMQQFSGKSRKKLARELQGLERFGVSYRYDHIADIDLLVQMNLNAFGDFSYFKDRRFLASFEKLVGWLKQNGMLRITTLLLGDSVAAIDMGAVWRGMYTVMAGATNPNFPGVAKMINFHHIDRACRQKYAYVDFLCGDFGWKKRFHLSSRPLFEINRLAEKNIEKVRTRGHGQIREH
jgi:hypothetical protein